MNAEIANALITALQVDALIPVVDPSDATRESHDGGAIKARHQQVPSALIEPTRYGCDVVLFD